MRSIVRLLIACTALVLFAQSAWARELTLEAFDGDYVIGRDASVLATERIRIRFSGSWNGVIRDIPTEGPVPGIGTWNVRLRLVGVTDDVGASLKHEVTRGGGAVHVKVWVPGAEDAVRTVVIQYRLSNVLRSVQGREEFYWNVTGLGWDSDISSATATVHLPAGTEAAQVARRSYVGAYGSRTPGAETARTDGNTLRFESPIRLSPHEGLTIAVGLPEGAVEYPSFFTRATWVVADNPSIALPIAALLFFFVAWVRHGRDPGARRSIALRIEPPEGLRPAEVGVLIDGCLDPRDLTATLVDLAARGQLRIEEVEGDIHRAKDFRFVKCPKASHRGADAEGYEIRVLDALFPSKNEALLSTLGSAFAKRMLEIGDRMKDDLVSNGYLPRRPDTVKRRWTVGAAVVTVVLLATYFDASPAIYFPLLLLCSIGMFVCARAMPRFTRKGAEAMAEVRSFESYLKSLDAEATGAPSREMLGPLLPYAIALGISKSWALKFPAAFAERPDWYGATGDALWTSRLDYLSWRMGYWYDWTSPSRLSSPYTSGSGPSAWHGGSGYSGGGGFGGGGGGGFSGGGFGGGGGSGF